MEGVNGVKESDEENAIGPLHIRESALPPLGMGSATSPNAQADCNPLRALIRAIMPLLSVSHPTKLNGTKTQAEPIDGLPSISRRRSQSRQGGKDHEGEQRRYKCMES